MTDTIFDLAASLGEDAARVYETPARPGPVEAGSWKAGGPVPKPQMPKPVGPPRFAEGEHRLVGAVWPPEGPFPGSPPDPGPQAGDGPPRPGQPGPPPQPQPGPVPHPPPPSHLPRSLRPAWRMATRPIELGEGPLYDVLPKP